MLDASSANLTLGDGRCRVGCDSTGARVRVLALGARLCVVVFAVVADVWVFP